MLKPTFAVVLSNVKVGKLVFIEKDDQMLVKSLRNKIESNSVYDHEHSYHKICPVTANIRNNQFYKLVQEKKLEL